MLHGSSPCVSRNSAFPSVSVLKTSTIVLVMRTPLGALADLLFGRTRSGVLALLFGRPDESFYVRQIARHIKGSVGTVQRELEALAQLGLIHRSTVGQQVFHQANRSHPVFAELQALIAKTIGTFQVLRTALEPLANRISLAFVYGSVARQEENAESDVDLMIVGDVTMEEVLQQLAEVEGTIGRPVNPTLYSATELQAKLTNGNHFLHSVIRGKKVFLVGEEDELRKMGGVQLAQTRTDKSR
jgi:uncharacterized protein